MDPLQWMGAVRMRIQTTDQNISIIHTTRPSINVLLNEKYVHNKKTSIIHNNASFSEKSIPWCPERFSLVLCMVFDLCIFLSRFRLFQWWKTLFEEMVWI